MCLSCKGLKLSYLLSKRTSVVSGFHQALRTLIDKCYLKHSSALAVLKYVFFLSSLTSNITVFFINLITTFIVVTGAVSKPTVALDVSRDGVNLCRKYQL